MAHRICCGENDVIFVFRPLLRTLKYSKFLRDFKGKYFPLKSLRNFEYFRVRSSGRKTKITSFSPQHIRWAIFPPPPGICSRHKLPWGGEIRADLGLCCWDFEKCRFQKRTVFFIHLKKCKTHSFYCTRMSIQNTKNCVSFFSFYAQGL